MPCNKGASGIRESMAITHKNEHSDLSGLVGEQLFLQPTTYVPLPTGEDDKELRPGVHGETSCGFIPKQR